MRKRLSATLLLVATIQAMSPAYAAPAGRLRMGVAGGAPPPPAGDLALTIRPTDSKFADLTSLLSDNPDNAITVTVSGPVAMSVWPLQDQITGSTVWYKRELVNFLSASTSAATPCTGCGVWTLSYKSGAGETGSTITKTITWDVAEFSGNIPYSLGKQTKAYFGGPDLSLLPGLVANKSITSNPGSCFTIFNGRLVWAAAGAAAYSTTSPPAKACANPTTGAAAYTVQITDSVLGQSWNYVLDVPENEWNVAVGPTDNATNTQLWYTIRQSHRCGDQIVLENGNYASTSALYVSNTAPVTNPVSGQVCPSAAGQPYAAGVDPGGLMANGWFPDDTYHPGWVTIRSRNPLGATIAATSLASQRSGQSVYNIRMSNIVGAVKAGSGGFGTSVAWIMQDHSKVLGRSITQDYGGAQAAAMFIVDNYLDGQGLVTGGGVGIFGANSQIVGNWTTHQGMDSFLVGMYDLPSGATCGPRKSLQAWNFSTNKRVKDGNTHPDHSQSSFEYLIGYYDTLPAESLVCLTPMIGEIYTRGLGRQVTADLVGTVWGSGGPTITSGDVGKSFEGGHLLFWNEGSRDVLRHDLVIAGNFMIDMSFWGMALMRPSETAVINHNYVGLDFGPLIAAANGGTAAGRYSNGLFYPNSFTGSPILGGLSTGDSKVAVNSVAIGAGNAADGDTVNVNGSTYTFQTVLTNVARNVLIGADAAATAINLKDAIVRTAGQAGVTYAAATVAHSTVTATASSGVVSLAAKTSGAAGNAYTLAATGANITVGGATFSGGLNAGWAPVPSTTKYKFNAVLGGVPNPSTGDKALSGVSNTNLVTNLTAGGFTASLIDGYHINPGLGDGATSIKAVIDAFQAPAGSPLLGNQAETGRVIGPFGNPSIIDHRRRRYSSALFN